MATIDYKEKYEKAVQAAMLAKQDTESAVTVQTLEEIFPELRESEDERISKEIISAIKEDWPGHTDWIAWLEKQGEQKPFISYDALREGIAYFGITQYQIDNWLKKYVDVEKQGEQKPAEYNRETSTDLRDIVDNEANAIWKEESTDGCHLVIDSFNMFYGICMQIAEAVVDYKKPAWGEDDEMMLEGTIDKISDLGTGEMCKEWLKSLKERVQPQPKQEWSEEDKRCWTNAISACKQMSDEDYDSSQGYIDAINWLKSLRPQSTWKPSEEQFNNTSCTHLSKEEAESKVWKQ